jgi:hypothetical protein
VHATRKLYVVGVVLAVLSIGFVPGAAAQVLPAPPQVYVDTTFPVQTGRTISVAAGGDLQGALNSAQPGDTILLAAGATFMGAFTLPVKSGAQWIVVRTSAPDSSLPPQGTRITPAYAGVLPKIIAGTGAALQTAPGAHHYRFVGIEFGVATGVAQNYGLLILGDGSTPFPYALVFDRVWVHGNTVGNLRRGFALNCASAAIIDSYISEVHEVGADSQAISGWMGPGPFKISNNYLEAAGENIMFGGADPTITNLVPSDIEVRGNYFYKPLSWRIGDPSYAGTPWTVKNLFELKDARRVLADGNVFEHSWLHAQSGFAILFTPRNQGGTAPWTQVDDVTFTNNIIRHAASGMSMLGTDDIQTSQQTMRVLVKNNLFDDINGAKWGGAGRLYQVINGLADLTISHNTAFQTNEIIYAELIPNTNFFYTSNLTPANTYGITGRGTWGNPALAQYFPGAVVSRNVMQGANAVNYPPNNFFPATMADVFFTDLLGANYRLLPISPYKNAGTDGKDVGVDFDALNAATVNTVSGAGTPGPPPPPPPPPPVDTTPPTVSITSPIANAVVSGTIPVVATALDNVGVVGLAFFLDGIPFGSELTLPPYQVSWDTTRGTSWLHTWTAVARDAAGNSKTSVAVQVMVSNPIPDVTPPSVAITAPVSGATLSGTTTITATASDNVGVVGVQFLLDGVAMGAEVLSPPYQISWNTTTVTNALHMVGAVARDAAGNRKTSVLVTITVNNPVPDTTPPSVAITAPANGASVSGTLTISANASDNVGVVGVQFLVDGVALGSEVTSAPYQMAWNTTTASNAPHSITATARDAAGNRTTATAVSVTVANPVPDTTPPNVAITAPANGASVSGTLTISANASDNVGVVGVQFILDGAPFGAEVTSAPYQRSWNTTTATNGTHSITATARDAAGNRTTATAVSVTVANPVPDTTPPSVSITAPANGATVSGTLTISASASDNVGVVGVQFILDGAPLGAEVASAPYQVSWTTGTNGLHAITATARDAAGNRTTATAISVTVANPVPDTTPPSVSITSPANGATVSGTLTISASASDNVGVVGVQFILDGAALGAEVTSAPYQMSWTTRANGLHTITATARDAAGNRTTATAVSVTVANPVPDTTPPNVSITAPANGATVSGTTTISANASDNIGVVGVLFLVDGVAMGSEVTSAPYQMMWNTTTATNGPHTITATARDAAGNRTSSAVVSVTVANSTADTIPPTVSITRPANGATLSGITTIAATASDNVGVVGVQILVDGTPVGAELLAAPYEVAWDTTRVTVGSHRLTATARDAAGNAATSAAVTVSVFNSGTNPPDTTPPVVFITSPNAGGTLSGIVAISATATDNVGVFGVQFLVDGMPIGVEVTSAPYQVSWNTAGAVNGSHTLTAVARDAAGNRSTSAPISVTVSNGAAQPPGTSGPRSPFHGSPIQIPGQFEAEDFDKGGEGVAYHDTTPGNQGGAYRTSEDVDIISPYPLGFVVTNIEAGEWLTYTINVNKTGTYRLEAVISSENDAARFRAEVDGVDKTGSIAVPNTEWLGRFRSTARSGVSLTAGQHILRIYFERGGFNLDSLALLLESGSGRDRVVRH